MNLFVPVGELNLDAFPTAPAAVGVRAGASDLGGLFAALLDGAQFPAVRPGEAPVRGERSGELFGQLIEAATSETAEATADQPVEAYWSLGAEQFVHQAVAHAAQMLESAAPGEPVSAERSGPRIVVLLDELGVAAEVTEANAAGEEAVSAGHGRIGPVSRQVIDQLADPDAIPVRFEGDGAEFERAIVPPSDAGVHGKTKNLTVRIDQEAWERLQRVHAPVKLEIPVEMDIPERPVPVGHEVVRQLQALTEFASSVPVNLVSDAPHVRVRAPRAMSETEYVERRVSRHERVVRSLGLKAPFGDVSRAGAGIPVEDEFSTPARTEAAVTERAGQHYDGAEIERVFERPVDGVARAGVRTVALTGAERAGSAMEFDAVQDAPQVRFVLDSWAPGRPVNQLRITLDPAELGGLQVNLTARRGGVFARIVVDRPEALPLVQANFDQLQATLAQRGVQFSGFSISVASGAAAAGVTPGGRVAGAPGRKGEYRAEAATDVNTNGEAVES